MAVVAPTAGSVAGAYFICSKSIRGTPRCNVGFLPMFKPIMPRPAATLSAKHHLGGSSLTLRRPEGVSGRIGAGVVVRDALLMETEERTKDVTSGGIEKQNTLQFVKYQGLGNDFLLVDNRDSKTPKITPSQAMALCDRNFGVGGDGVIFVMPGSDGRDYTMRIFNSDGSEPEMCGNGIRCMAKFVAELEGTTEEKSYNIDTLGGLMVPKLLSDGQVCVDMGPPILEAAKIPTTLSPNSDGVVVRVPVKVDRDDWSVTCVSMGNPHCIVILDDSQVLSEVPLSSIGPLFESHEVFPARTNTGATLACGTGACAVVVAAVLEGRAERKCEVELPGGPLQIEWGRDNHLYMTGPAQKVFAGEAFL